jgi:hypothetical protein
MTTPDLLISSPVASPSAGSRLPFFIPVLLHLAAKTELTRLGLLSPSNRGFLFKLKQSCSQVMACDFF